MRTLKTIERKQNERVKKMIDDIAKESPVDGEPRMSEDKLNALILSARLWLDWRKRNVKWHNLKTKRGDHAF